MGLELVKHLGHVFIDESAGKWYASHNLTLEKKEMPAGGPWENS